MRVTPFRSTVPVLIAAALAIAPCAAAPLAAQDTPASTKAKQDVLWQQMADGIQAVARGTDAVVGVAILDLTDQRLFTLHADAIFPTASTIKLAVLAELYRQHGQRAGATLSDAYTVQAADLVGGSDIMQGLTPGVTRLTNRDLATMMIAVSDNSATNVLIDRVGMARVNTFLEQQGLRDTRLRRKMMDVAAAKAGRENTATPQELVTLLAALHRGSLLGGETAAYFRMLGTGKMSYLPRLLPDTVQSANKPGDLDGVRNDAGIVFVPNRPFAIAVMTTYGRDARAQEEAIARIGQIAWRYFDRIGSTSPLGRVVR